MVIRTLIVIAIIGAAGFYARSLEARRSFSERLPELRGIPTVPSGWNSKDYEMSADIEAVLGADAYLFRDYRNASGAYVGLFVGYFSDQTVGAQIHSPRNCLPGSGWNIKSVKPATIAVPGGEQPAMLMRVERNEREQQVLYWFLTRGGTVTGEYALKWDLVRNSLAGRPTDAAFIRFMADTKDEQSMRDLIAQIYGPLRATLAEAGLR